MTPQSNPTRCAGRTEGWTLHPQCQNCLRKTTAGAARQAHFLAPAFVDGKCPLRRQA